MKHEFQGIVRQHHRKAHAVGIAFQNVLKGQIKLLERVRKKSQHRVTLFRFPGRRHTDEKVDALREPFHIETPS